MSNIKNNIEEIQKDIKDYSIYPEKVKFIAVTKYVDAEVMNSILDCGVKVFGENKAQVIKEKYEKYLSEGRKDIEWHFIGNLQKNKVKYIAPFVKLIHSVNKLSLAQEIDKRALQNNRVIDVLLEINIAGEESKEGYELEELYKELPQLLELKNINIIGLMTMAPFVDDEALVRGVFRRLREIKDELNKKTFNGKLTELSMGMTNDYKIALEEGATIIRVGRKIYQQYIVQGGIIMNKNPLDKIKVLFGLDNPDGAGTDSDIDFEESGITDIEIVENKNEAEPVVQNHILSKQKTKQVSTLETEMGGTSYQTIFLDPKTYSDCKKIVDYIRADKMVTLNLEYLDEQTAVRLMNFLSGAMTVKDANYLMISKKVYTVVPKSMKVYYEDKKIISPKIFKGFGEER